MYIIPFRKAGIALLVALPMFAQAQATPDEAKSMLASIVAQAKAQGVGKAAEAINAGTDATKCKEKKGLGCMIATSAAMVLANAKNQKLVGNEFPADFADIDGTPIVKQIVGPINAGKSQWEAQYKFAVGNSAKAVPQHAFCEKIDAKTLACVILQ